MSLRRLVARTVGHSISQPTRLISPQAELLVRAFTDEGEFHAEISFSWHVAIEPTPSFFLTCAVSTFVTYFLPDLYLRSSLAGRRIAGDFIVPPKDSYVVDRSRLEIAGKGNKGAATKGGADEWERVPTSRLYYPGQSYEADAIAPQIGLDKRSMERQSGSAPLRGSRAHLRLSNVLDYRNARLLNLFVSDAGKILPRRRSRLSAKVHRKAVKHIKTSRVMGISAMTERLQELTKPKK